MESETKEVFLMEQMEKIETLREKTGCTYTEAKAALEASGGDLLDALCWLEQRGKSLVTGAYSSTAQEPPPEENHAEDSTNQSASDAFAKGMRAFWTGLVALIRRGNSNHLVMKNKSGDQTLTIPMTIFVILLVAAFWVVLPLMVVALFFGCRFACTGPDLGREDVNRAMGKATDFAEEIKKEFQ